MRWAASPPITCRAAFACADNVTNKKMIEYGMEKTTIAFTTSCLLPLAMVVPILSKRLFPTTHPLEIFLWSYVLRLLVSVGDPFMLRLALEDQQAAWQMWVGMAVLWVTVMTTMFTAQMEFFSQIADPVCESCVLPCCPLCHRRHCHHRQCCCCCCY